MMLLSGDLLPVFSLAWPLLLGALAALPFLRSHALRLLPLAPLPALVLAAAGMEGTSVLPPLLMGVVLHDSATGMLLFAMTAMIWFAAGIYASKYMEHTKKPAVFTGFWCLTLTGNLGVFLAADVFTFYAAFAMVSLAAYFLVVHEVTDRTLRAGNVYIILAVLGEACLLVAFLIGAVGADSYAISDIRASLANAAYGQLAILLLILGFGMKAGLVPLHIWLPLAHPAAPTPASAVLSGTIVKAGVIGLMVFLPAGAINWGILLIALGFAGCFAGALYGLSQHNPKTILAYSTISQMGIVLACIGAAIYGGMAMEFPAFYAFHHGLAKAALFLSVGVLAVSGGHYRKWIMAIPFLAAGSMAGFMLSGGALAKATAKHALPDVLVPVLTVTAITTTWILVWFLYRLRQSDNKTGDAQHPPWAMLLPAAFLAIAAMAMPWVLWEGWSDKPTRYLLSPAVLWTGIWPIGIAVIGIILFRRGSWRLPQLPEGDMVIFVERWLKSLWKRLYTSGRASHGFLSRKSFLMKTDFLHHTERGLRWLENGEQALRRWYWGGFMMLLMMLLMLHVTFTSLF